MKRHSRSGLRINGHYEKRKNCTSTVSHFIVFPVTPSTIGKSNDFYLHSLSLCWNDKNMLNDARCKHMLRGLYLKSEVEHGSLAKSAETGWFSSSRSNDLRKIGNIAGYFIRNHACSVAVAMDEQFVPGGEPINNKEFNDFISGLKEGKTIVPTIVKLDISPDSYFDTSKFICLDENFAKNVIGDEVTVVTRRAKILNIKTELHDWAWRLLNVPSDENRQELIDLNLVNDILSARQSEESQQIDDRRASSRNKLPSKKYPSDTYITL